MLIQHTIHSIRKCGKSGSLVTEYPTGYLKMQVRLLSYLCDPFCLIFRVRQSISIVVIQGNRTSRIMWAREMIFDNPYEDSPFVLSLSIKIIFKLTPSAIMVARLTAVLWISILFICILSWNFVENFVDYVTYLWF